MQYLDKQRKLLRPLCLFWTGFIGIGALVGTTMFFLDPQDGFFMAGMLQTMRQNLPFGEILFQNLIFSGFALLIANGLTNLTAFVLLLRDKKTGYLLTWIFGITLMAWIAIQFYAFAPMVYAIDVVFFLFGLLQFLCGYWAFVNDRQRRFVQQNPPLPDRIGSSKEAVIYFSRLGYVRRLAALRAQGCDLIELKTDEPTRGTLGFWWCGRFAMHRWGMKLQPLPVDLSEYTRVYIFSPIWVFRICAPVRQLLKDYGGKLPKVELTCVHFMRSALKKAFTEAETLLGRPLKKKTSLCSRLGSVREVSL